VLYGLSLPVVMVWHDKFDQLIQSQKGAHEPLAAVQTQAFRQSRMSGISGN
jgi:hypothetical protein